MRIAQVAPLTEAVPPKLYGGTERVVHWLTEELVALGHDVTLVLTLRIFAVLDPSNSVPHEASRPSPARDTRPGGRDRRGLRLRAPGQWGSDLRDVRLLPLGGEGDGKIVLPFRRRTEADAGAVLGVAVGAAEHAVLQ